MSNETQIRNQQVVKRIQKQLETQKVVRLNFEQFSGTPRDIYKEIIAAGLKTEFNNNGNFVITK